MPTGSTLGTTPVGGVDLNKPRMHDALRAALALAPAPNGFRERVMKRFASAGQAQRFLFAFSHIRGHFRPRRHLISASQWRTEMTARFAVWDEVIAAAAV